MTQVVGLQCAAVTNCK